MKKRISVLVIVSMLLSLCACRNTPAEPTDPSATVTGATEPTVPEDPTELPTEGGDPTVPEDPTNPENPTNPEDPTEEPGGNVDDPDSPIMDGDGHIEIPW